MINDPNTRLKTSRIAGPVVSYVVCCLVLGIIFAETMLRLPRLPVSDQPFRAQAARQGAVLQDVSVVASDAVVLRGWFARPASHNGDAIILLHGFGGNRQRMTALAEIFLSKGYAVLLPDVRAHGLSGGDYPTYGLKESDDVAQWYRWLKTQQHAACVFGVGESMGAAILLQAIRTTPLCGVVADSPFANFRQFAYIQFGQTFHTGTWLARSLLRPAVEVSLLYAKLTRGVNLSQASPENSVARSTVPVLLIHGLADHYVPARQSEMIRSRNPQDVTLWEVPKAGHSDAFNVDGEEYKVRVLDWLSSHGSSVARPPG